MGFAQGRFGEALHRLARLIKATPDDYRQFSTEDDVCNFLSHLVDTLIQAASDRGELQTTALQLFGDSISQKFRDKMDDIVRALGFKTEDFSGFDSESEIMKFLDAVLVGLNHNMNASRIAGASTMPRSKLLAASAAQWAASTDAQRVCELEAWQDQTLRDAGLPLMNTSERAIYAARS